MDKKLPITKKNKNIEENNRKEDIAKINKKTKRRNRKKITWQEIKKDKTILAISFLVLVVIIYCLYKVITFIQNPTDTFSVEQGKIYQEEATTGYIIREETVVKGSNYKNGMLQIKTEGERVAKGEPIFRYYSSGEESLIKKIEDLDSKIDEAMSSEKALPSGDIKALEKQIEEKIISLVEINNLQTINETKKEISSSITKKAKIAGSLSPAGSYLKKLIDERSKYETQLNEGAEYLNSPISGVVSYKVDGYEEALTPSDFSTLTKEFLDSLNIKTGQVVADSKESGKIINNFKCYVVCSLKSEQAKEAKVGDTIKLRLPNNAEVSGSVEYISKEENDVILIFKLSQQVQELVSYRKISFDIIWWSYSGKKVANEAIGTETKGENQISYVIRTRAGYQDKIWIKVLRKNDKYTIVDNYSNTELRELGYSEDEIKGRKTLTLYDEILKKPT